MEEDFQNSEAEAALEEAMMESLNDENVALPQGDGPGTLDVFPLLKRPFFPGMASPLMIEPGPFYEVLKRVAKSSHKSVALVLSKKENKDIYKLGLKDLYKIGVFARVLRIIPMEKGGAQVILNMEKRIKIVQGAGSGKTIKAKVSYHDDHDVLS